MSKLVLSTEPVERPLTVDEVAVHLNEDRESEFATLNRLIDTATSSLQFRYWTQFVTAIYTEYFDEWGPFDLCRNPVLSVSSVAYTDSDGNSQTVDSSVWETGDESGRGVVRLAYNQQWPSGNRGHTDDIKIVYSAGYGLRPAVPEPIRQALLLTISDMYTFRETMAPQRIVPIAHAIERLMSGYSYKTVK